MKKKILLFTFSVGIISLSLSSYRTGPAYNGQGDRTGRLGLTCAAGGCHSSSGGATTCTIQVLDKTTNQPVTKYTEGTVYTVKISGTNPSPSLAHFGFQITCVNGTGGAGTWQNLPANTHTAIVGGVTLVEQGDVLSKDGSGNYTVSIDWKAPAVLSATFHGIINAVNNNNSENGDAVSAHTTLTVQNVASVNDLEKNISVRAYPNPLHNTDVLQVEINDAATGNYIVNAFDLSGRKLMEQHFTINTTTASHKININTANWAAGLYHVQVIKDGLKYVTPVVKN